MANFITGLFGVKQNKDYRELMHNGAVIIDVRTKGEFQAGHIKNSLNIPLDTLSSNLSTLKKDRVLICCCASGMRSGAAKSILTSNGFNEVYNGGAWTNLQNRID
ncbi:MAG: rhodanese-like domain-containing protein [Ginsengibacter sp.]